MKRTIICMLLMACLLVGCARQDTPPAGQELPVENTNQLAAQPPEFSEDPVSRDRAVAAFEEIAKDKTFAILIAETADSGPDIIDITPENSYNLSNRRLYLPVSFVWSAAKKADWERQMAGETGYVLSLCSPDGATVMRCCEKGDVVAWKQDGQEFYARAVNPKEGELFEEKIYHFFRLLADNAVSHQVWYSASVDGDITDLNAVAADLCVRIAENYRNVPDWVGWKPLDVQPGNVKVFDVYRGQPEQFCADMGFWVQVEDIQSADAGYWMAGAGLDQQGTGSLKDHWSWNLEVHVVKDANGDWYCSDRGSGGYSVVLPETGKDGPSLEGLVDAFYLTEGFSHDWLIPYHILERLPEQLADLPALLAQRTAEEQTAMQEMLVGVLRENKDLFPDWTEQTLVELLSREGGA